MSTRCCRGMSDSPTTFRALRNSKWISSTPGALPPRSFPTTLATSARVMDGPSLGSPSSASSKEGSLVGLRRSLKYSFHCPTMTSPVKELFHLKSLEVSLDMAHKIEMSTREQSSCADWHLLRKPRVTASRFREVCHVRGHSSAESLAERIIRGTRQTAEMKRGLEMESGAASEYCRILNVNYTPCGLIIHPDAPWLGASPDGVVFDPTEYPQFGLVEIKCPNVKNYIDCKYLYMEYGCSKLKKTHAYYWQIQGQLLISGLHWCDFVVWAQEDFFVERVYMDADVQRQIPEKTDLFYFYTYMTKYLSLKC
ncbi:uncharacterized protein LOC119264966 [Pygocentrus nattereri]|uniref:uncharacterized protein LOC119264966 n=1 Tax=Pygocentrus nattereri TaxID=42514 RepID=UPI00189134FF|nr:uncharacterized protein LOC119264966 [Pygocentrus nattereri]